MPKKTEKKFVSAGKVLKLDYHRNGVSGLGFWVGIVQEDDERMLVVRFPKEHDEEVGNVLCAAFNIDKLNDNVIEFFYNSYRGDYFHKVMDKAIDAEQKRREMLCGKHR